MNIQGKMVIFLESILLLTKNICLMDLKYTTLTPLVTQATQNLATLCSQFF
jgi:hypothetical protein